MLDREDDPSGAAGSGRRELPGADSYPQGSYPQVAWRKKGWGKSIGLGLSSVEALIEIGEENGGVASLKVSPTLTLILTPPEVWLAKRLAAQQAGEPLIAISTLLRRIRRERQQRPQLAVVSNGNGADLHQDADPAPQPAVRGRGRPRGSLDRQKRRPRAATGA